MLFFKYFKHHNNFTFLLSFFANFPIFMAKTESDLSLTSIAIYQSRGLLVCINARGVASFKC